MESVSTPRISGRLIDSFVGRNVMIVGKVLQLRGDSAIIEAEGQITALLNRVSTMCPLLCFFLSYLIKTTGGCLCVYVFLTFCDIRIPTSQPATEFRS